MLLWYHGYSFPVMTWRYAADFLVLWLLQTFCLLFLDVPWTLSAGAVLKSYQLGLNSDINSLELNIPGFWNWLNYSFYVFPKYFTLYAFNTSKPSNQPKRNTNTCYLQHSQLTIKAKHCSDILPSTSMKQINKVQKTKVKLPK